MRDVKLTVYNYLLAQISHNFMCAIYFFSEIVSQCLTLLITVCMQGEIKATGFNDAVDKFYEILETGKVGILVFSVF